MDGLEGSSTQGSRDGVLLPCQRRCLPRSFAHWRVMEGTTNHALTTRTFLCKIGCKSPAGFRFLQKKRQHHRRNKSHFSPSLPSFNPWQLRTAVARSKGELALDTPTSPYSYSVPTRPISLVLIYGVDASPATALRIPCSFPFSLPDSPALEPFQNLSPQLAPVSPNHVDAAKSQLVSPSVLLPRLKPS